MLFGDNNIEYSQYKSEKKNVITDNLVVNRNIIIKYASLIWKKIYTSTKYDYQVNTTLINL